MVQTTETVKKQDDEEKDNQEVDLSEDTLVEDPSDQVDNQESTLKKAKKVPDEEKSDSDTKLTLNVVDMPHNELRSEIRERETRRSDIFDNLKEINKERNLFKETRNKFNKESMESFQKVSELKTKRDKTNAEIKELKTMRASVLTELKQFSSREKEIFDSFKKDNQVNRQKNVNPRRVAKEIESLEWTLQTTAGVTLDQERDVIERIDELNESLESAQSTKTVQQELRDIKKRKSTLKNYLDDSWKQLNELVAASQSRHKRLSELYDLGKQAKQEADHNHKLFIVKLEEASEFRKSLRIIRAELDLLYPRYKEIRDQKKKVAQKERYVKESHVKDAKSKEIRQKLSAKKGLSMAEMKFLMENKLISLKQDKTK